MNTMPSYRVFARVYRPKTFGEILGQDIAVQIFQNALKQNTLSHAILLTGIRGIGKTTSARLLAKTLCCLNPLEHIDPCGTCYSCTAFDQDQHTDIVEMDAASHTGVDDIRDIIEGVSYAPIYGRYRVYIIDEVHMLSKNAFNALLKTLEEPPAHAKFIFATTEISKVPETILSRCLQIELLPMSADTIQNHVKTVCDLEGFKADIEGLKLIAEAAQGSMRDALSILEKIAGFIRSTGEPISSAVVERVLGRPPKEELKHLCNSIQEGNIAQAINIVREFFNNDIHPLSIAKSLLKAFHHSLCEIINTSNSTDNFFSNLSVPQLNRLWAIVHQSVQEITHSPLPKESCEVMIIRLCHVSELPPLKQLIQDVEQKLNSVQLTDTPIASSSSNRSFSDFTNFESLVAWVDAQKEPELSYFLKREIRIHGFTPGHVECSLQDPSHQHFLRQLKQLLQTCRNETWIFEVVHTTSVTPSTLHELRQERETEEKNQLLQSEIIQHALKTFEGSTVQIEKIKTATTLENV
jgi:DNA polymerase-3 subunit gamma/tau